MLLDRYLRPRKMGLLKGEVESLTRISLKTTLHWLINKNRLQDSKKQATNKDQQLLLP